VRRSIGILLTIMLILTIFSGIGSADIYINFGTGSPGSTYYTLGGPMAELWNNYGYC